MKWITAVKIPYDVEREGLSRAFRRSWQDDVFDTDGRSEGCLIVTCCAGCASFLGRVTPTIHLIDLIFEPTTAIRGKPKNITRPFSYLNRLRLKRRFAKIVKAKVRRERHLPPDDIPS